MQKLIKQLLPALALLLASGCCNTQVQVIDEAPAPVFPSCETILDALRPGAPDSVYKDWVKVDNVMLKLRSQEAQNEQEKFGKCAIAYHIDQPGAVSSNPKILLSKLQGRFGWIHLN